MILFLNYKIVFFSSPLPWQTWGRLSHPISSPHPLFCSHTNYVIYSWCSRLIPIPPIRRASSVLPARRATRISPERSHHPADFVKLVSLHSSAKSPPTAVIFYLYKSTLRLDQTTKFQNILHMAPNVRQLFALPNELTYWSAYADPLILHG